ncbi:MAG: LegC family aminotransferase [Flavobacteriales bacterium]|nr:LegC family aminotransferase [Flavobacteriales bacterium]
MFDNVIDFIRSQFPGGGFIPLHEPRFRGQEKKYLEECIDSGFVSSVGEFVNKVEVEMASFCGAKKAVACMNGTAAIHIGLHAIGVQPGHEVLTQAFTFVATGNAISYTGARPYFIDIDRNTLGMCPWALKKELSEIAEIKGEECFNRKTGAKISACVPMHTFGFPCEIEKIIEICNEYHIPVLEDAAESVGSTIGNKHTGTFGKVGTFSFNGNKIITSGGGGFVVTNDEALAHRIKHLTTTAKVPHAWEYEHDETGFNYRMPNINAALLLAQLEMLPVFLEEKKALSQRYRSFFKELDISYRDEIPGCQSNFWLNTLEFQSKDDRDAFLKESNGKQVMTRPPWKPLHQLSMFRKDGRGPLIHTEDLYGLLVNIPSSADASNSIS